ncbi:MAG: hypothetical protein QM534_05545 [Sediminibacterium sp.]|nr:hypothetical protein [Sediminibacterium sp.]
MKKKFLKTVSICILAYLVSCDCLQKVEGVVVDSKLVKPLPNVKILRDSGKDLVDTNKRFIYTDTNGRFTYFSMRASLFRCPKIKLIFEKEGYKRVKMKFKSCCVLNDTIYLSK